MANRDIDIDQIDHGRIAEIALDDMMKPIDTTLDNAGYEKVNSDETKA